MRLLNAITQDARQQFTLIGEAGQSISFTLFYLSTQQQWAFNLSYGNVNINGAVLTCSPNVLRGYKNLLNFGLMCISTDGEDPWYINDFVAPAPSSPPRISLFLLNAADVALVEEAYFT